MNLEEALDTMIKEFEWDRESNGNKSNSYIDSFETILHCADQEWQNRQLTAEEWLRVRVRILNTRFIYPKLD